ncbi:MAG TPA: acyltransferase, partial [Edaphobacter sp.]
MTSPDPALDQKLREQPARDYCKRLAEQMKGVSPSRKDLSDALEESWSKAFHPHEKPKRIDASTPDEIAEHLHSNPRLQARIASLIEFPPSKWLLERELAARGHWSPERRNEDVYVLAESLNLKGICFSGGGIRSATFNLGVLQGLSALGKLGSFDYLSTVSGGGYIHQFLASWVFRDRLNAVEQQLQPLPGPPSTRTFWPEPLRWLRRYSNYLTPKVGLFTADTWV